MKETVNKEDKEVETNDRYGILAESKPILEMSSKEMRHLVNVLTEVIVKWAPEKSKQAIL